jgi:hypothetical protein
MNKRIRKKQAKRKAQDQAVLFRILDAWMQVLNHSDATYHTLSFVPSQEVGG